MISSKNFHLQKPNTFIQTYSMKKQILKSFCCACILGMMACNTNETKTPSADSSSADTAKDTAAIVRRITTGVLDTLWVDSLAFAKLPAGKLVFQYYVESADALTLHGWSVKTFGGFETPPNIKLTTGRPSSLNYGPGSYFGDLVLKNAEINKIQKALKDNKSQFVLFAPKMDGVHIKYEIFVGKDDPGFANKDFLFAPKPTGLIANPSPPRSFD
jgi:hypothetical protein